MSTQPFTSARYRAFDANGAPLVGGLLYTYAAGTTTPLSTYTTRAGDIANANPVVLDGDGEADVWLSPGLLYKFVLKDANGVIQTTVDNWPASSDSISSAGNSAIVPGGRLTLTSGVPIVTTDVTGATTVYYVPYRSDQVPLYDGTNWATYSIGAGLSQAASDNTKSPAAAAINSNYDLFVWNDGGTVRLSRGPPWPSDTARGTGAGTTEIFQVNGHYVNKNSISNGPGASLGLYVGTVRANGSAQFNDSLALRHVWNNNNRVLRPMRVIDATSTWGYTLAAWRQANANAGNQLSMIIGLNEEAVKARADHHGSNNASACTLYTGIGLDATTALAAGCTTGASYAGASSALSDPKAAWEGFPGAGLHFLAWLEYSATTGGVTTWQGSNTPTVSGIQGELMA